MAITVTTARRRWNRFSPWVAVASLLVGFVGAFPVYNKWLGPGDPSIEILSPADGGTTRRTLDVRIRTKNLGIDDTVWLVEIQPGAFYVWRVEHGIDNNEWLADDVAIFTDDELSASQRILVAYIADRSAGHSFELWETLSEEAPALYNVGYGSELPPTGLLAEDRVRIILE